MENNARLLLLSGNSICFTFLASKAVNGRAVELARLMVFMALVSTAQICPQIRCLRLRKLPQLLPPIQELGALPPLCSLPSTSLRRRRFRIPFVPANTTSVSLSHPLVFQALPQLIQNRECRDLIFFAALKTRGFNPRFALQVCEKDLYRMDWAVKMMQKVCKVFSTAWERNNFLQCLENTFAHMLMDMLQAVLAGKAAPGAVLEPSRTAWPSLPPQAGQSCRA